MAATIKATNFIYLVMLLLVCMIILNIIYSDKGPLMENKPQKYLCVLNLNM